MYILSLILCKCKFSLQFSSASLKSRSW